MAHRRSVLVLQCTVPVPVPYPYRTSLSRTGCNSCLPSRVTACTPRLQKNKNIKRTWQSLVQAATLICKHRRLPVHIYSWVCSHDLLQPFFGFRKCPVQRMRHIQVIPSDSDTFRIGRKSGSLRFINLIKKEINVFRD